MKCAVYCRVSTTDQHTENQLAQLQDYARTRGWEIVATYSESETAWKTGHQTELPRCLHDCRNGHRFDIVLTWALDRLSREGAAAILNLVSRFKAYGVRVISLQESWTEAPGELGEVLYAIAGWSARMESQRRSERTKAGLARLKAMGKTLGRPLGSKDKKRRLKKVRKIHAQYLTPAGVW